MDRSLSSHSMDNVLDNLLFKAAQFPRTDSEDQFRKFLERIPSTTNLASHSSLPQAQQEQLQQQMAQFQQQSLQLASSTLPLSTQLPEGGSLNVGGIPRVPSLDLLRQLVTQQQQQQQQQHGQSPHSKATVSASASLKEEPMSEQVGVPSEGELASATEPALSPRSAGSLSFADLPKPMPMGTQMDPAIAAATTLQLGNMPNLQAPAHLRKTETAVREAAPKDARAEVRRARRMLSNRESARRSRRRKQEHLSLLEEQISQLEEERDQMQARLEKAEKQAASHAEQNQSLKRENEELRRQLGLEGKEKRGPGSHPNKKMCNGH